MSEAGVVREVCRELGLACYCCGEWIEVGEEMTVGPVPGGYPTPRYAFHAECYEEYDE